MALQPCSLDAPFPGQPEAASLADILGEEDPALERMLGILAVAAHWAELPRCEQQILVMRFYGEMTQAQIGHNLGISQMQVSRLLAHALGYLRPLLLGATSPI
jgi:RNA polymerase sigma-B factor